MHILSVDDNASNLYLVEMIARAHGHEVVSARNGVEALERLAAEGFDLIISDILMPGMDGFQLCRTVKNDPSFKRIPFVFYTATYTTKQDEELGLALGASRFVIKPVEPDEFLAIIEQVMKEGEAGRIPVPDIDLDDGGKSLNLYNERLVRKLEHKIQQLEAARAELSASIEEKDREIRQRRLAEAALARSEEQLRLIWDASMDGMVLSDSEGIILRANQAFARILREPLETLSGQPIPLRYDDNGKPIAAHGRERIESGAIEPSFEGALRLRDGEIVHIEGSSAIVALPSGPAVVSVLRDVTARKRFEQERAALEEQLRQAQKLESVGRLAGGIAHDFNNLLTIINGYSDLLASQMAPDDPFLDAIKEISKAGQRASALTRRLLGFTRKQPEHLQSLDLNRVVRDTIPLLARLVGEDIELVIQLHPQPVAVSADVVQLEQILMNLAVNSRDAMPKGGRLRIETGIAEWSEGDSARHSAPPGSYAVLSVTDDGEGMTEETRQRIFEPFFTTKAPEKGTGLGLSIVHRIVAQSQGRIEVQSAPGQGATFRIYLPSREAVTADSGAWRGEADLTGNETVLVVEDQTEVRTYTAAVLRRYGYRVLQAARAAEARETYDREQGQVDLVLTDVVMPDGSGKDLAEQIRERQPGARVLFMSGYADDATMRPGLASGATDFIQKPFSPAELAAKVREILGETR